MDLIVHSSFLQAVGHSQSIPSNELIHVVPHVPRLCRRARARDRPRDAPRPDMSASLASVADVVASNSALKKRSLLSQDTSAVCSPLACHASMQCADIHQRDSARNQQASRQRDAGGVGNYHLPRPQFCRRSLGRQMTTHEMNRTSLRSRRTTAEEAPGHNISCMCVTTTPGRHD